MPSKVDQYLKDSLKGWKSPYAKKSKSSKMPKRSRKGGKRRVVRKRRSLGKLSGRTMIRSSDTYHFKGRGTCGELVSSVNYSGSNPGNTGGIFILTPQNLSLFAQLSDSFEFFRINRCSMEFLPKFNMSVNLNLTATQQQSINGTLVTAIDEVPVVYNPANTAGTWVDDNTTENGPWRAYSLGTAEPSPSYIRTIQNSRETELYKKQVRSLIPTFYTQLVSSNTTESNTPTTGANLINSGVYQANRKRWLNCKIWIAANQSGSQQNPEAESAPAGISNPGYFPMFGIMYNLITENNLSNVTGTPIYDVRYRYSISFRRLSLTG